MAKNYFTDEQVKSLVKKSMPWAENMQLSIPQLAEFKALMNLAVETAIGEPVAYAIDDIVKNGLRTNDVSMVKIREYRAPLYSVKELEN